MSPSKYVVLDYDKCEVEKCEETGCLAVQDCTKDILIQEAPGATPMLKSPRMCVGCGDCISSCKYSAIRFHSG
jgi:translation initiation factor RLI1